MTRKLSTSVLSKFNPFSGKVELVQVPEDKNNDPTITRSDVTKLSVTKNVITRIDYGSGDFKTFTYNDNFTINTITENVESVATVYTLNYDGNGNVTSKTITP